MPMYVYEAKSGGCAKCASPGFEVMQSLNDAKLTRCPDCGAEIFRVIQAQARAKGRVRADVLRWAGRRTAPGARG